MLKALNLVLNLKSSSIVKTGRVLCQLVERYLTEIYQRAYMVPRVAEKTLILFRCLLKECETWACPESQAHFSPSSSTDNDEGDYCRGSRLAQYVADCVLNTLVRSLC